MSGLFALGFGLTAWGKYLMPQGPFVEERHEFHSTEAELEAMTAAIDERGGMVVKRRRLLGGLFALGSTVMGIVLLFPLLRSLGPPAREQRPSLHHQLAEGKPAGHRRRPPGQRRTTSSRRGADRVPRGLRRLVAPTRPS